MLAGCESVKEALPEQVLFTKPTIEQNEEMKKIAEEPEVIIPKKTEKIQNENDLPEQKKSGGKLVMLHHYADWDAYTFVLSTVDTDTEETLPFKQFTCTGNDYYSYAYPGHERRIFSENFKKMAIDRVSKKDGTRSIGWMEATGKWTDVSEKLHLTEGEVFRSVGFYKDRFVFEQIKSDGENVVYSVPENNVSLESLRTGKSEKEALPEVDGDNDIAITDRFKDGNYIVNELSEDGLPINSLIVDVKSKKLRNYIPESDRINVQGVLSPDEKRIAFISVPLTEDKVEGIFIAEMESGESPLILHSGLTIADHFDFDLPNVPVVIDWIE